MLIVVKRATDESFNSCRLFGTYVIASLRFRPPHDSGNLCIAFFRNYDFKSQEPGLVVERFDFVVHRADFQHFASLWSYTDEKV